MARNLGLPTWVQNIRLLAHLILLIFLLLLLCACFAYCWAKLSFCVCMSDLGLVFTEITMLSNRMSDYPLISQGKTRIPGVNDAEEFELTVVSLEPAHGACVVDADIRRLDTLHQNLTYPSYARSLQEFNQGNIAQVFFTMQRPNPARHLHNTLITTYRDKHDYTV